MSNKTKGARTHLLRRPHRALVCAVGWWLSACGGGGVATDTAASVPMPLVVTTLSCDDDARVSFANGVLVNNMWNQASAGTGPRRQCLLSRNAATGVEYGWSWEWPTVDGLYAFPEVLVGASPWRLVASIDVRFPRTVSATRALWVDYAVDTVSNGKQTVATEYWFTASRPNETEAVPVKAELMLVTDAPPELLTADEVPVGRVSIDGAVWSVYIRHDWGDPSGNGGERWTFIYYVAATPSQAARVDARKFFADAIGRGVIAETDYVAGVELGNEITSGSGSTWVRRLSVSVE